MRGFSFVEAGCSLWGHHQPQRITGERLESARNLNGVWRKSSSSPMRQDFLACSALAEVLERGIDPRAYLGSLRA